MKGKRLRQGQGHGDQQGKESRLRPVQFGAPLNWLGPKQLSHARVRGSHVLFTVPPLFLLPKNIFIFH